MSQEEGSACAHLWVRRGHGELGAEAGQWGWNAEAQWGRGLGACWRGSTVLACRPVGCFCFFKNKEKLRGILCRGVADINHIHVLQRSYS